jgi:hypothetical protein
VGPSYGSLTRFYEKSALKAKFVAIFLAWRTRDDESVHWKYEIALNFNDGYPPT